MLKNQHTMSCQQKVHNQIRNSRFGYPRTAALILGGYRYAHACQQKVPSGLAHVL